MPKRANPESPALRCSDSALSIDDFALQIIEGPGGLNSYQEHEIVSWPYSDRVAAAVWTIGCLGNPHCEGSDVAIAAILERRKQNDLSEGSDEG